MKAWILILLIVLGAGALCLFYGFFLEPRWIKVKRRVIPAPGEDYQGKSILFFSDIHVGKRTRQKDLDRQVRKIMGENADAVIFGGDLVEEATPLWDPDFRQMVIGSLARIKAPLGQWAILGNHDTEAPRYRAWAAGVLESAGFTVLENEGAEIAGLPVWAFADSHHANPVFDRASLITAMAEKKEGEDPFTLYLIHESDWFPQNMPAEGPGLVLCGHSHQGQVTLFGLPLIRPAGAKTYWRGSCRLNDHLSMMISAGLGTVHIHARFFARPDLLLIRFVKKV